MKKFKAVFISGFSGSGKDTVSDMVRNQTGYVALGFADHAKRNIMELYGWTEQDVFGPSHLRNLGNPNLKKPIFSELQLSKCLTSVKEEEVPETGEYRYGGAECNWYKLAVPGFKYLSYKIAETLGKVKRSELVGRQYFCDYDPQFFLSPRETLQIYCETMNILYNNTWVDRVNNIIQVMSSDIPTTYSRAVGLEMTDTRVNGACIPDMRHVHEFKYAKENHITVRVKRPSIPNPPYEHRSETEQTLIEDKHFDIVLDNDGTLADLEDKVQRQILSIL